MILIKQFTFNPYQENTFVLSDESKQCIIIDPGCYEESEKEELVDYIKSQNLKVEKLVNTHCHIDHVLGNKFIADKYKVKLYANKLELPVLQSVVQYAPMMGISYDPSPDIDVFLSEKDTLTFGDSELKILFCPGHSPGSICFFSETDKFLIGGDVLFQMSIGRTDLPGGDHDTLMHSIKEKVFKLPDDTMVYPGHGPVTNIVFEKKSNPFLI